MNAVPYPIALDHDRNLSAEIGLLLSAYAIIDLFILHIYSVVSTQDKDTVELEFGVDPISRTPYCSPTRSPRCPTAYPQAAVLGSISSTVSRARPSRAQS